MPTPSCIPAFLIQKKNSVFGKARRNPIPIFMKPIFIAALVCSIPLLNAQSKPNILIIVADDLGYNDLGFQGSKDIATPHLDKLAAQGVRCTNGYVNHPFCSPTRAALMTGRYQHRFGHENNPEWLPASTRDGLPLSESTIADALKQQGYKTGHVGKWHLGAHPQFHPLKRGFDECFAALGGGHQYFPAAHNKQEYNLPLDRNSIEEPQKAYLTDQFGDEACAFAERHAGSPWFLYLAFNAPHGPLQAPPEIVEKLTHIAEPQRRNYAAMIQVMDTNIGKLIAKLDSTKQRDNTLIFFISDNGGPLNGKDKSWTDNSPLRGGKGDLYEGGTRVPFLVSWPAKLKPGTYDSPVIALDFHATALAQSGGNRQTDGVNLIPHLTGERSTAPHETLFWRSGGPGGKYAARQGNWKLVRLSKQPAELYDLSSDVAETKNLATEKPDIVTKLVTAIAEWEKGTVAPIFENPRHQQKKAKKAKDS
jgi:arylsulfatase A-like enzyme